MKAIIAMLLGATAASAYTLHEWGTFTTVAGSDGVLLPGLEREETLLPWFTHSLLGQENGNAPPPAEQVEMIRRYGFAFGKGIRRPVRGVTVKMETPVIYFHSERGFDVSVRVGFQGGTISQWFPRRSGGEVLPEPEVGKGGSPFDLEPWTLDYGVRREGWIEWNARVLSPEESRRAIVFKPRESLHWMRPRVPEANVVRAPGGETEGFLFYRGIGAFDPGLETTVGEDGTLWLGNSCGGDIPFALVFERSGALARWAALRGGIPEGGKTGVPVAEMSGSEDSLVEPVYREMCAGLVAAGLFESEARAMIETWWDSYFATEGLRVFWIVPAAKTDVILPLSVSPAPERTVRVMVGRSEVLRPSREREWLALSRSGDGGERERWERIRGSDRFGAAYGHRVDALARTAARPQAR